MCLIINWFKSEQMEYGGDIMKKLLIILDLFNIYFLTLILIQGSVLVFYDYNSFKAINKFSLAKKSRYLGFTMMLIAILLFIVRKILL